MRHDDPLTLPTRGLIAKAFLIDPECPSRNSGGIISRSPAALELLERAHGGKLGSVIHDHKQCAGLLCLNGVRSLEFFEGSLDEFRDIVSELFPLNTQGVVIEIPAPGSNLNLPYEEAIRIAAKYELCDRKGGNRRPLFQLIQAAPLTPQRTS